MNLRSGCDHKAELIAQAQAYLQKLQAATQAARERVYAGVAAPFLQPPGAAHDVLPESPRIAEDPIFATREFELPPAVLEALEHGQR